MGFENFETLHDPGKVIFYYCFQFLTVIESNSLCKDLNFAIPPKKLEYADYLLLFEILYRDIHDLDITNEKKEVLKSRIKDCAFSSFNSYNENDAPLYITPEEFAALKSLSKNKKLFIQKSDKSNSVVAIVNNDSLKKMRNILSHSGEFSQVSATDDEKLSFIVKNEKNIIDLLRDLKKCDVISENAYKSLKPRGSRFRILYGLCNS